VTTNINYVDRIVAALAERLDDCEIDLLRQYALLVLVTGEQTTEQDAHDAWAVWRTPPTPGTGCSCRSTSCRPRNRR